MLNLVVWNKSNAGQGSFYRSQHELIGVFRVGGGRTRTMSNSAGSAAIARMSGPIAGVNIFGRGRMEALSVHPTVKPIALVADALLDCTARGDAVLDQCAGSGTIILAAEKVGRIAYGMEYEPAMSMWPSTLATATKLEAILDGDGRAFEEINGLAQGDDLPRPFCRTLFGNRRRIERSVGASRLRVMADEAWLEISRGQRKRKPLDDAVGYGRPPKATQFKAGQSGNPKGRPKGSRPVGAVLHDILRAENIRDRERQNAPNPGARGYAPPACQRRHAERPEGRETLAFAGRSLRPIAGAANSSRRASCRGSKRSSRII